MTTVGVKAHMFLSLIVLNAVTAAVRF